MFRQRICCDIIVMLVFGSPCRKKFYVETCGEKTTPDYLKNNNLLAAAERFTSA